MVKGAMSLQVESLVENKIHETLDTQATLLGIY
jgi:hypothetical protein